MPLARFTVVVALGFLVSVLPSCTQVSSSDRGEYPRGSERRQNEGQSSPKDAGRSATIPEQPEASTNARPSTEETQHIRRNYFAEAFAPSTLSNWALFVAAIGAGFIALSTLKAIQRQVEANILEATAAKDSADIAANAAKLAERALHLTERADLLITGVNSSVPGALPADTVFTLVFKNFGRTRADSVAVNCSLGVPDALPVNRPFENAPTVVGAGDTLLAPFDPIRRCLTQDTYVKVLRGEATLVFEAKITYRDVFGRDHRTNCSGTYLPKTCAFRVNGNQAD